MSSNYAVIIRNNLERLFAGDLAQRAAALPARRDENGLIFKAFGAICRIDPNGVHLDGAREERPLGIIISLYAMPDSAPYAGAFANRTQQALVPAVARLANHREVICTRLDGSDAPAHMAGDLAFIVRPLPKIALCYVCYLPDDDFPAGVTCLYANNASRFLPTDALADVGEYTTRTILDLLS